MHERTPHPFALNALDAEEARAGGRILAEQRRAARKEYEKALEAEANAQKAYRKKLAESFVQSTVGSPSSEARTADAKKLASQAEYERDIKRGLVKAAQEKLNEVDGERATFHKLVEWSHSLDPLVAETYAQRMEQKR